MALLTDAEVLAKYRELHRLLGVHARDVLEGPEIKPLASEIALALFDRDTVAGMRRHGMDDAADRWEARDRSPHGDGAGS